ncbi:potassium channel family protein [Streptomyces viridochromogenes]|uniref:Putative Ion transport 2 domain protein n=1 Tax=Streptomyces viridochromogenes Tue57 TaxID=1160705 RepID=L8PQU8_STRVR|nr:potassium channel family protein [Streptomyces viridochromogenes]ELS58398.1 putative Ion transport 2 domain protein [Streptomyces viridochromogenes Tue57]
MEWLVTLIGAALVLIILRDLFHTLWHPTRHGGLSRFVMTLLWRLSTRGRRPQRAVGLTGPVGMVIVVSTWACAVAVGWALVYWPHMPEAFAFSGSLKPSEHSGPVDALYLSLVIVATLGLGDIAPSSDWLRIVAPLEALVGFALLTATVSWILGLYPALARRRALALRISQLRRADAVGGNLASDAGAALLDQLAAEIARACVDFLQYPESYYFHDGTGGISLALNLEYAADLAEQARLTEHLGARNAGALLATSLDDLAAVLDDRYLHTHGTRQQILAAYARDHGNR